MSGSILSTYCLTGILRSNISGLIILEGLQILFTLSKKQSVSTLFSDDAQDLSRNIPEPVQKQSTRETREGTNVLRELRKVSKNVGRLQL